MQKVLDYRTEAKEAVSHDRTAMQDDVRGRPQFSTGLLRQLMESHTATMIWKLQIRDKQESCFSWTWNTGLDCTQRDEAANFSLTGPVRVEWVLRRLDFISRVG